MRKYVQTLIGATALLAGCVSTEVVSGNSQKEEIAEPFRVENPLPVEFGDPYILKASDGLYYMVGTGGVRDGFKIYSSTDLQDWKDGGVIYKGNTDDSWCVANFWAPELWPFKGIDLSSRIWV